MHVHKATHLIAEQDIEDLDLESSPRTALYLCCVAFRELISICLDFDLEKADLCAWLETQGVNISLTLLLLVHNHDLSKTHASQNVPFFLVC